MKKPFFLPKVIALPSAAGFSPVQFQLSTELCKFGFKLANMMLSSLVLGGIEDLILDLLYLFLDRGHVLLLRNNSGSPCEYNIKRLNGKGALETPLHGPLLNYCWGGTGGFCCG